LELLAKLLGEAELGGNLLILRHGFLLFAAKFLAALLLLDVSVELVLRRDGKKKRQ
jgi:hypothetical protein